MEHSDDNSLFKLDNSFILEIAECVEGSNGIVC
jgi:hypothetical protein